jgi:hypothetical protein
MDNPIDLIDLIIDTRLKLQQKQGQLASTMQDV